MAHQNIHTREETHCELLYQIHGFSKQSTDRQSAYNIFAEEECKQGNYQSYNSIFTNLGPKESRTIEDGNHSSQTRI